MAHCAEYFAVDQSLCTVAEAVDPLPLRLSLTTWSLCCNGAVVESAASVKFPMTTIWVPSGLTASFFGPSGPLRLPVPCRPVSWTVMLVTTAPVVPFTATSPLWVVVCEPVFAVVNAPPMYRLPPTVVRVCVIPFSTGGVQPGTRWPVVASSRSTRVDAPFTVVKLPATYTLLPGPGAIASTSPLTAGTNPWSILPVLASKAAI